MRACAAVLLALALGGCASCFIDALPQSDDSGMALDCDPAVSGR